MALPSPVDVLLDVIMLHLHETDNEALTVDEPPGLLRPCPCKIHNLHQVIYFMHRKG